MSQLQDGLDGSIVDWFPTAGAFGTWIRPMKKWSLGAVWATCAEGISFGKETRSNSLLQHRKVIDDLDMI